MLKKLRFKFVLVTMTIVTITLCVIFGMMYHFVKQDLERESFDIMESIAENPFRMGRPGEFGNTVQLPYFTLQLGSRGEIVATGGGYYDLSDDEFLREIIDAAFSSSEQIGVLDNYDLRFRRVVTPVNQYLIFVDTSSEQATLQNLLHTSLFIGIIAFVSFLGISILLARWMVRPVDKAWQQQRQFVSDASHELKTPLTVIMTNAELLQAPDNDEESRAMFSDNILAMSRKMRKLLEQMLELARSDCMQNNIVFSRVDFSTLIQETLLMFETVFLEKSMPLESNIAPDVFLIGGETQLRQLLEILLDNAQKYATPGGRTQVSLLRQPWNRCLLVVANEGDPIPSEHLQNLFKRFYRADAARSSSCSFGLGLSIAQSIVMEHKGKIWVQSRNGINSFHVELSMQ